MYKASSEGSAVERIANIAVPAMLNADQGHTDFDIPGASVGLAWFNDGEDVFTISVTIDGVEDVFVESLADVDERDVRVRTLAKSLAAAVEQAKAVAA